VGNTELDRLRLVRHDVHLLEASGRAVVGQEGQAIYNCRGKLVIIHLCANSSSSVPVRHMLNGSEFFQRYAQ
jgi:hypothetical protein